MEYVGPDSTQLFFCICVSSAVEYCAMPRYSKPFQAIPCCWYSKIFRAIPLYSKLSRSYSKLFRLFQALPRHSKAIPSSSKAILQYSKLVQATPNLCAWIGGYLIPWIGSPLSSGRVLTIRFLSWNTSGRIRTCVFCKCLPGGWGINLVTHIYIYIYVCVWLKPDAQHS